MRRRGDGGGHGHAFTTMTTFYFSSISLPFAIWAFTANVYSSNWSLKHIKPHQKKIIYSLRDMLNAEGVRDLESESLLSIPRTKAFLRQRRLKRKREGREEERKEV